MRECVRSGGECGKNRRVVGPPSLRPTPPIELHRNAESLQGIFVPGARAGVNMDGVAQPWRSTVAMSASFPISFHSAKAECVSRNNQASGDIHVELTSSLSPPHPPPPSLSLSLSLSLSISLSLFLSQAKCRSGCHWEEGGRRRKSNRRIRDVRA